MTFKRLLFLLLFFTILVLYAFSMVLTTRSRLGLPQFSPTLPNLTPVPDKDNHFLDRVANNLIFSENPLEFSTGEYYEGLLSKTQTNCQHGGNTYKCYVYIGINMSNIDKICYEFAIQDPKDDYVYLSDDPLYIADDHLYIAELQIFSRIETEDDVVINGKLYGFIEYKSGNKTKKIYFSPTVKLVVPLNDSRNNELIKRLAN